MADPADLAAGTLDAMLSAATAAVATLPPVWEPLAWPAWQAAQDLATAAVRAHLEALGALAADAPPGGTTPAAGAHGPWAVRVARGTRGLQRALTVLARVDLRVTFAASNAACDAARRAGTLTGHPRCGDCGTLCPTGFMSVYSAPWHWHATVVRCLPCVQRAVDRGGLSIPTDTP